MYWRQFFWRKKEQDADPKDEWCGPAGCQQTGLRVQKPHPDHSAGPFLKVPLTGILGTEAGKETPLLTPKQLKKKNLLPRSTDICQGIWRAWYLK